MGVLGAICGLALYAGDWAMLVYDADYLGNRCGVGDYADKPKAFYPRIPLDMMEQPDVVASGSFWKLKRYALCVDECPSAFSIDNPTFIADYGYDPETYTTAALGSGTRAQWISVLPTIDMFNRCIPRIKANADKTIMCAYPKCTATEVSAVGGTCYAGGAPFTNDEWAATTDAQKAVCQVELSETNTLSYSLASGDEASAALLTSVASSVGGFYEIVTAFVKSFTYILAGGVGAPLVLAFAYMLLLFLFAKTIIYAALVVLIISQLAATFILFTKSGLSLGGVTGETLVSTALSAAGNLTAPDAVADGLAAVAEDSQWMYAILFVVMAIVSVLTIIMVLTSRRKIARCAAIVKESTSVFLSQPLLMVFPVWSVLFQILVCLWFLGTLLLIYTTKPESIDNALSLAPNASIAISAGEQSVDVIGGLRSLVSNENYSKACTVIVIYGFFVLVQWVRGISWCTMSGAVYYWFFFGSQKNADPKHKQRFPIASMLCRVLFYHTGSVAFAAFVIAMCDMLRVIAAYVEKQMGPAGKNIMVKLAFKCIHCLLACLKKTVEFVSYYGLVFVATQGTSFCGGCYKTFFFFLQNPGQVAINALVTKLLTTISILASPTACAIVFYYIMDGQLADVNAIYPAGVIGVMAALMTVSCMTVFSCTITTVFVCCFQDKAEFDGKYMSPRLAKAFGINKKDKKKDGDAAGSDAPKEAPKEDTPLQSV